VADARGLLLPAVGKDGRPSPKFECSATYHYLATGVAIKNAATQTLGHEIELEASWKFLPNATLMAGYSFMNGTETMNLLKRTSDKNHLHWAWLMVVVTPEFFSRRW
jgi:hypothetical protein